MRPSPSPLWTSTCRRHEINDALLKRLYNDLPNLKLKFDYGAVHKVRHAILDQILLPPVTHSHHTSRDPPKVRHASRNSPIFSSICIHTCLYREVCLSSRGFLSEWFCPRVFSLEGLVRGGFCPSPLLSEYIRYNRKLNITFNSRFHMYETNLKSMTSHYLGPPPSVTNCHTSDPLPFERDVLHGRPLKRLNI